MNTSLVLTSASLASQPYFSQAEVGKGGAQEKNTSTGFDVQLECTYCRSHVQNMYSCDLKHLVYRL